MINLKHFLRQKKTSKNCQVAPEYVKRLKIRIYLKIIIIIEGLLDKKLFIRLKYKFFLPFKTTRTEVVCNS